MGITGPITKKIIQEFTKKESLVKKKVEAARAKLKAFKAEFPRSE
jgi:hypothetical protein